MGERRLFSVGALLVCMSEAKVGGYKMLLCDVQQQSPLAYEPEAGTMLRANVSCQGSLPLASTTIWSKQHEATASTLHHCLHVTCLLALNVPVHMAAGRGTPCSVDQTCCDSNSDDMAGCLPCLCPA